MKTNKSVRKRLKDNELVLGAFMKSTDPAMAEIMGYSGLDFIVVDNEHVAMNKESLTNIMRAAELSGTETIIRVMKNEQSNILQALDAGANGVQVPNIDTAEQAKELDMNSHYPPLGTRGLSPNVRAAKYGDTPLKEYISSSLENTLVVAHIETKEGYENLDAILDVEGIDVIFIGPMDLSQSFGIVGDVKNPILVNCIDDIVKKSLAKNKAVGTVCSAAQVDDLVAQGMRYLLVGNDQGVVLSQFKAAVKQVRG